jgi:hypothetical protein
MNYFETLELAPSGVVEGGGGSGAAAPGGKMKNILNEIFRRVPNLCCEKTPISFDQSVCLYA